MVDEREFDYVIRFDNHFPDRQYSDHKDEIKQAIKDFGLKWNFRKGGWTKGENQVIAEFDRNEQKGYTEFVTFYVAGDDIDFLTEFPFICEEFGASVREVSVTEDDIGDLVESKLPRHLQESEINRKIQKEKEEMYEFCKGINDFSEKAEEYSQKWSDAARNYFEKKKNENVELIKQEILS